jgi:hypothetical protein
VPVARDVVYHSIPSHLVYFSIASLKRVVVQKRQSLPCILQGINCTKLLNENACPSVGAIICIIYYQT